MSIPTTLVTLAFLLSGPALFCQSRNAMPQQPPLGVSPDKTPAAMPLRWGGGWLLARVKINGMDAGWFKIATGWADSAIDAKVAQRLNLPVVPQFGMLQESFGRGAQTIRQVHRVDSIECGAAHADDLWISQYDMTAMSQQSVRMFGEGLSGVIGWDLLRSIPFTLDYGTLELTWHSQAAPSPAGRRDTLLPGQSLPMIAIVAGDSVPVAAMLNTANFSSASVRPGFAKEHAEKIWTGRRASGSTIQFLQDQDDDRLLSGGLATLKNGRRWISISGLGRDSKALAQISDSDDRRFGDVQIGYGFLRNFKLTFDGPSGELWSEPAAAAPETAFVRRDKAGLSDYARYLAMFAAIESDDGAAVRALISQGVKIESLSPGDFTPLAQACRGSARSAAKELLEAGAKVDPFPGSVVASTPLIEAGKAGDATLITLLLKAGASTTRGAGKGFTPLMAAAHSGERAAADALLAKAGLPSDINDLYSLTEEAGICGSETLMRKLWPRLKSESAKVSLAKALLSSAALSGQLATIEWVLGEGGASPGQADQGLPPLLAAIFPGGLEKTDAVRRKLVSLLLSEGANPNVSKSGVTPLLLAAKHGDAEIVRVLLKAGANAKVADFKGRNAIQRAAAANQPVDVLAPLLELGLKVNGVDSTTDRTPLGSYAWHGNAAACKALLDAGADPNMSSFSSPALLFATNGASSTDAEALAVVSLLLEHGARGTTSIGTQGGPLYGAIAMARSSLVEPLVRSGAEINQAMFTGVTAVVLAAATSDRDTLAKLLELGGNPRVVDQNGYGAVAHAAASGRVGNLALLLEKGASANADEASEVPPLCAAASCGQLASVRILLKAGADPNSKDPKSGDTPSAIAERRADEAMIKVLSETGGATQHK